MAQKKTYTVQSGESYASIAGKLYGGDQRLFNVLMAANDNASLHPGDVIVIPDLSGYKKGLRDRNEDHYVSPGLMNAVYEQEQKLGWRSGPGANVKAVNTIDAPEPSFPEPGYYQDQAQVQAQAQLQYSEPPAGSPAGTATVNGMGWVTPVPPGTITPGSPGQSSLNISVPNVWDSGTYAPQITARTYTTPGGRPITPQQNAQYVYGIGPRPMPKSRPDYQVSAFGEPITSRNQTQTGYTASIVAALLDKPLTRQKAPGTYQAPGMTGQGWGYYGLQNTYGGYVDTQVRGGKPGAYLRFEPETMTRTIGGETGYPDLQMPNNMPGGWPSDRRLFNQFGAPAGGGGSGYYPPQGGGGGGYAGGGYGPPPDVQPGLNIRASRSYVPSRFSPFPFFGNSGVRRSGIEEARSAGIVALTSWTL